MKRALDFAFQYFWRWVWMALFAWIAANCAGVPIPKMSLTELDEPALALQAPVERDQTIAQLRAHLEQVHADGGACPGTEAVLAELLAE